MLLSTVFALAAADFDCNYVSDGVKLAPKMRFLWLYLPLKCDFGATPAFLGGAKRDKRCDHRLHWLRFAAFYRVLLFKYHFAWSRRGVGASISP